MFMTITDLINYPVYNMFMTITDLIVYMSQETHAYSYVQSYSRYSCCCCIIDVLIDVPGRLLLDFVIPVGLRFSSSRHRRKEVRSSLRSDRQSRLDQEMGPRSRENRSKENSHGR
jgi:hypothetical protein